MAERTEILVLMLTDIEGSSRLWQEHAPHMAGLLERLDRSVFEIVNAHGGMLEPERGEGDSHFACFQLASDAVRASVALQRLLLEQASVGGIQLSLRIALHAGEIQRRGSDYAGVAVNRAARLRSTAHGGQIVASRAIRELVADDVGHEIRLFSLGWHRVRDIPAWTEIFAVWAPGLQRSFPSLVTLDAGLPPISAIVFLDTVSSTKLSTHLSFEDEDALWAVFVELWANTFARAQGHYLQHMGDGCLALFAEPMAAVAFVRDARASVAALDLELRAVVHVGRVRFSSNTPYGRDIVGAGLLMRRAPGGKITLTPAAAALVPPADDIVVVDPNKDR
ncbi:MAG TPA: adenylate/guanylate cyclase domain-containing protein [Polyangiales bacterium]|nr:adenylate/guanylate cyclase domain-containing protein [Polyangiales bacterium]